MCSSDLRTDLPDAGDVATEQRDPRKVPAGETLSDDAWEAGPVEAPHQHPSGQERRVVVFPVTHGAMESQAAARCEETTHVALRGGASLYSGSEMIVRRLHLPVLSVMVGSVACSGAGYESAPGSDGPTRVSGVLFVERTQGAASAGVQIGARFVRFVGVAEDALPDLVGTPAMPRVGACVARGTTAGEALDPLRSEVRLLEIGRAHV